MTNVEGVRQIAKVITALCSKHLSVEVKLDRDKRKITCERDHEVDGVVFRLAPSSSKAKFTLEFKFPSELSDFEDYSTLTLAFVWSLLIGELKYRSESQARGSTLERWQRGYLSELPLFLWLWEYDRRLNQRYDVYFGSGKLSKADFIVWQGGVEKRIEIKTTSEKDEHIINYREPDLKDDERAADYVVASNISQSWPFWVTYYGAMTKDALIKFRDTHKALPGYPDYYSIPLTEFKFATLSELIFTIDTL